ncbi:hypothetical protein B0H11DRAFT_2239669 [Mycena galericulata]|nr:hypothetical protein B0H11DRAFT_2239669 [Mycena galericulata]
MESKRFDSIARFLSDLAERDPRLLASRKAITLYAMYTFNVLNVFDETPRFFPVIFRIPDVLLRPIME